MVLICRVFFSLNLAKLLKTLKDALGVDAIVGPSNTEAYINQAETIVEQQEKINDDQRG